MFKYFINLKNILEFLSFSHSFHLVSFPVKVVTYSKLPGVLFVNFPIPTDKKNHTLHSHYSFAHENL